MARIYIDLATGCWLWTGYIRSNGYVTIWVNEAQKKLYLHRVMYELFKGEIPTGMTIDHLCRVRHCCNPEHLEVVTQQENLMRGDTTTARNAAKVMCINGHAFDESNTYIHDDVRHCRTCRMLRQRDYVARKRSRT